MVETAEIEYEPVSAERQKMALQEFAQYLNCGFIVEGGVPAPIPVSPTKAADGWTTQVQFLTAPDDVTDAELDDEPGDEEFPDDAKERRWVRAIFALLSGKTHAKVAVEVGVSNRQLSRWKVDPKFIKLYQETKAKVFAESINGLKGILTAGSVDAAQALIKMVKDDTVSDTAKVQAAKTLTHLALEISDLETLAQDIAALKAAQRE